MRYYATFKKILAVILTAALAVTAVVFFTGTTVKAETDGVWVLTSTDYFTPSHYISKQNGYYQYNCSFDGFTQDGSVRFTVSGGYMGPGDWFTGEFHHECTQPGSSYLPGETVSITMTSYEENLTGNYHGGQTFAEIYSEDLESPYDGRNRFYPTNYATKFCDETGEMAFSSAGVTCTGYADMPKTAEYGERVAVTFVTGTAYDSMSNSYENEYGGHQFYEWIYTFMSSEEAASVLNSQQSVNTSGQTSVQENDTSVTTNVQTQGTGAENLLVNPNWDNGTKGWEKTDSLEEELEDGKTALRSTVYQDIPLSSEQAGAKVSYGGWICVNNARPDQDQIRISLAFFSSDGTLLSYDSRAEYGYELKYHEINMSIPFGAAYMRASISIRKYDGNNVFSFNDLALTVSQVNPGGFKRSAPGLQ